MISPAVRRDSRGVRGIRWYGVCRKCRTRYRVPFVHPMAAQQMAELCPCEESAGTLTELAFRLLDRSA